MIVWKKRKEVCAVTILSHKIISSVLLAFSVMSIAPLYNGRTVSDYIFESLGFSSWPEDGAHISVIPGVVLYFAALIWCAAAFRRTLPAAGLFLIFLSMGPLPVSVLPPNMPLFP